ncbi:SMI1/KNR4 family protein [Streptomyces sp. NPDC050738]|uniref:SMI1/KNR4 family protein n=1 Tax=Streptomyces sp. NPDC050738 TaxID=3154744 RepID=UPI00341CA588
MTDLARQRLRIAMSALSDAIPHERRRPPLGWPGVQAWEAERAFELPEPYRTFVAEISNGTQEGPSDPHGLLALGQLPESWQLWEAECWLSPDPFDGTALRKPAVPFPLKEEWQWEYDYYDHDQHSPLLHGIYQHGSILLGSNRSCEFWILIVTGPQRGRVWWLGDGCAAPYADAEEEAEPEVDFVSWLQDWQADRGWWSQDPEDLD